MSSEINKQLFRNLRELNLPLGEYVVFGSGPMGIRNLRDMHDIDLIVTQDLFDQFKNNPDWETKDIYENNDCFCGLINRKLDIEMFTKWYTEWDTRKLIKEAEMIDGLPFVKLEYVVQWKKQFASEKDLRDVELVKRFQAKQSDQGND
jgi:hypothetical protein